MIDKIKLLVVLITLLPISAFAKKADIDCYYYNHEEHFKNVDWSDWNVQGYGGNWLSIEQDKQTLLYRNCIIREK